jgi:hypothetical protein
VNRCGGRTVAILQRLSTGSLAALSAAATSTWWNCSYHLLSTLTALKRLSPLPTDLTLTPTCARSAAVAAIARAVVIVPAAVVVVFMFVSAPVVGGATAVVAMFVSVPVAGGATAVGTVLVSAPVARGATAVVAVFVSAPMPCGQKQSVNGKLQLKLQLKFKWNTDGYLGFSSGSLQAALRAAAASTPRNCGYPPAAL